MKILVLFAVVSVCLADKLPRRSGGYTFHQPSPAFHFNQAPQQPAFSAPRAPVRQATSFSAPQQSAFSVPRASAHQPTSFSVPQHFSVPQQPAFSAPRASARQPTSFSAPQQPAFSAPRATARQPASFSAPQHFSAPQQPAFSAPRASARQPTSFSAPQQPAFSAPRASARQPASFSAPQQPAFSGPQLSYSAPSRATAARAPVVPILRDERVHPEAGAYSFNVETGDGVVRQESGSPVLAKEGLVTAVTGSYSFTLPNGQLFELRYVADENGFQPQSSFLPVAPVFPHPIPAHALEQIERGRREHEARARGEQRQQSSPSFSAPVRPQRLSNSYGLPQ